MIDSLVNLLLLDEKEDYTWTNSLKISLLNKNY